MKQVDFPIIGYDKYSQMRPPKEAMDPEDVLLFADLEEGEKPSISESSNSWLRFMEYGDSSVLAKQDVVGARMAGKHVSEESKVSSTKEERIEDSFKLLPPSRPDNPDAAVEAVWEVFPDEICACYDYGLVHFEGDFKEVNETTVNSYLRFHHSGEVDFCEQLEPTEVRQNNNEENEASEQTLEWKRSFVSSQIHPIPGTPSKEMFALMWDPASKGGVVKYVPLNDDYVYSLTGHVSVAKKIDT